MCAEKLVALVDSDSAYNFIDEAVRSRLTLPLHQGCHGLRVLVANDDYLTSGGICKQLAFWVSQETFAMDCYSILVSWFDIILGAQWLEMLGPIIWGVCCLTMSFWRADH